MNALNPQPVNPRERPGHNEAPDYAREVTDRMARDYAELAETTAKLLADARNLPSEVNDESDLAATSKLILRLRDTSARAKALHAKEKEPYLRGGEGVDQFFFGIMERIARRKKTDKAGGADVLEQRVDAYQQRKLAEEKRIRDEAERVARIEADRIRREREENERKANEAAAAAARARNPEKVEAHRQASSEASAAAASVVPDERVAIDTLSQASAHAAAKASDMVRTRLEGGELVTMRPEAFVAITDKDKLDVVALFPYLKEDALLSALKMWAKVYDHKRPMAGAIIEMRNKTVIR